MSGRKCQAVGFSVDVGGWYLVEAQVVLDGVGGVEDGPAGCDDHDEAVESLRVKRAQIRVRSLEK